MNALDNRPLALNAPSQETLFLAIIQILGSSGSHAPLMLSDPHPSLRCSCFQGAVDSLRSSSPMQHPHSHTPLPSVPAQIGHSMVATPRLPNSFPPSPLLSGCSEQFWGFQSHLSPFPTKRKRSLRSEEMPLLAGTPVFSDTFSFHPPHLISEESAPSVKHSGEDV